MLFSHFTVTDTCWQQCWSNFADVFENGYALEHVSFYVVYLVLFHDC